MLYNNDVAVFFWKRYLIRDPFIHSSTTSFISGVDPRRFSHWLIVTEQSYIHASFELLNADRSDNNTRKNKQENNTIQKKEQLLFPNFTQFHPHHLPSAFVRASRLTQSRLNQFQQSLSNYLKYYPERKLSDKAIVGERYQLPPVLNTWYYTSVGSKDWKRVCSQIPLEANWASDNLRMALEHLYQALPNYSDSDDRCEDKDDDITIRRRQPPQ
jgi:hypothetical protein